MKINNNQRGIAHIAALAFIVLALAGIGFSGFYVYTQSSEDETTSSQNTATSVGESPQSILLTVEEGDSISAISELGKQQSDQPLAEDININSPNLQELPETTIEVAREHNLRTPHGTLLFMEQSVKDGNYSDPLLWYTTIHGYNKLARNIGAAEFGFSGDDIRINCQNNTICSIALTSTNLDAPYRTQSYSNTRLGMQGQQIIFKLKDINPAAASIFGQNTELTVDMIFTAERWHVDDIRISD